MTDELLQHIANHYGTPTYVYDFDDISQRITRIKQQLPNSSIRYAVKANPNHALLKHMAAQGLGAEVISEGELARALRAGIPAKRILLGGPRQDAALIAQAVAAGVGAVSIDSVSQWQLWQTQTLAPDMQVLLRVNPALDPQTHEHLATGAAESKFGLTLDEAAELAETLGDKLAGFHVHAGSQIHAMDVYDTIFEVLSPLFERFTQARVLDIGGGFNVPDFPLEVFAGKVRAFAERFALDVITEPGRYLTATSGVLLSRVLHVKQGAIKHVIADAGMADLIRPALYGASHPVRVAGKTSASTELVDVDGPLCENADRLAQRITLPALTAGDLLVVENAGAYGMAMASNYASSFRPAEVRVLAGEVALVRRRETSDDLLRLELACD